MKKFALLALILGMVLPAMARATDKPGAVGIQGSGGIDTVWGLPGYGGGLSYLLFGANNTALEIAGNGYFNNGSVNYDTSDVATEGPSYKTNISIGSLRVNGLFNYKPDEGGIFFLAGAGFAFASRSWSDGLPSPEAYDYSSAGSVAGFGVGYLSPSGLEIRVEVPLYYFFDSLYFNGESTFIVAPTASVGWRFLN
jgi:hypothetical protein